MTDQITIKLDEQKKAFETSITVEQPDWDYKAEMEEAVIDTGSHDALSLPHHMKEEFPGMIISERRGEGEDAEDIPTAFARITSIGGETVSETVKIAFDLKRRDPALIGIEFLRKTNFEVLGNPDDKELNLELEHVS